MDAAELSRIEKIVAELKTSKSADSTELEI